MSTFDGEDAFKALLQEYKYELEEKNRQAERYRQEIDQIDTRLKEYAVRNRMLEEELKEFKKLVQPATQEEQEKCRIF